MRIHITGNTIEIGCGLGQIGRSLNIPITDAKIQNQKDVARYYAMNGQPTIEYPQDVEKLTAQEAMNKYKPQTVIGAYITHKYNGSTGNMYGVIEGKILDISQYINIGNDDVHSDKPILKHPHMTYRFDWLITRSNPAKNYIKIFSRKK